MKREEQENLLVEYVLGKLDWESAERVEELLRSDPSLSALLLEIQEGLESEVMNLEESVTPSTQLKSGIMQSLGFETSEPEVQVSPADRYRKAWLTSWVGWSGWGIAAAVVAITLFQMNEPGNSTSQPNGAKPALAIFEIPSDVNREDGRKPMIREVVYADEDEGFDGLSEAEVRSEELWSRYLSQRKSGRGDDRGMGFVVLDLIGKQGFAGFYDAKPQHLAQQDQQLWLYSPKGKAIPVGDLPTSGDTSGGVYYFSLEGNDLMMDSFESVVPVVSSDALPEI